MIPIAERRMFSKRIINSARFLKMPVSTQCLYFHLGLHADDDGIVEAYTVLSSVGATEDDLKILVAKGFLTVLNEDLVSYINDWRENNKIRSDRKIDSIYKDLLVQMLPEVELQQKTMRADTAKRLLQPKKNEDGQPMDVQRTTNGQPMDGIGKERIGKDRIVKDRIKKSAEALFDEIEDGELKSLYIDFYDMRKKMKAPMTEKAVKLLINKVGSLEQDVERQKTLLNEAILHGWKSVYPLKDNANASVSSQEALSQADRDFVEYLEGR